MNYFFLTFIFISFFSLSCTKQESVYKSPPAAQRLLLMQPILAIQNDSFFAEHSQDISSGFLTALQHAEAHPEIYMFKPETLSQLQEVKIKLQALQQRKDLLNEQSLKTSKEWSELRELIQKTAITAELK